MISGVRGSAEIRRQASDGPQRISSDAGDVGSRPETAVLAASIPPRGLARILQPKQRDVIFGRADPATGFDS